MVVRPSRESFHLAATTVAELNELSGEPLPIGWVLVGRCPWSYDEIVSQYGLPVLSVVADDQIGAEAVAGLRRLRRHSPLARSAQSFADDIAKHLRVSSAHDPLGYLEEPRRTPESQSGGPESQSGGPDSQSGGPEPDATAVAAAPVEEASVQ